MWEGGRRKEEIGRKEGRRKWGERGRGRGRGRDIYKRERESVYTRNPKIEIVRLKN